MIAPAPANAPLGIYVHIPYCTRICPYCDFNVYARRQHEFPHYVDALFAEIRLTAETLGDREIATIFIGGGTPSLLDPADIRRVLTEIAGSFRVQSNAEITMEANPEGLTAERLAATREAGINRLSIGVQTQQRHGLKVLGRAHRPEVPISALQRARDAGFDNISLDFIFGWPGQSNADFEQDLDFIHSAHPEHVSLYSLIIEPNTPYQTAVDRGILTPVDDDRVSEMYELAITRLESSGWDHYEISNWAIDADHRSRHNLIYWQNAEYLAFGAGAHGHLNGVRYHNIRLPEQYMNSLATGALPIADREDITPDTAIAETMMLGLRLVRDGVAYSAFEERHGDTLNDIYGSTIDYLESIGMIERDTRRIRLTRNGLLIANEVAERFLDPVIPTPQPSSR